MTKYFDFLKKLKESKSITPKRPSSKANSDFKKKKKRMQISKIKQISYITGLLQLGNQEML